MSDDAVQDLSETWTVRDAALYRSANDPGDRTRFGSTVSPDALRAALDNAARTVRETPADRDGYAVPLHEPGEPATTDEYVLWKPDAGHVGWFDTAFGIDGDVRFADVADAAATTLGDRLRCWHPDTTPDAVDPLVEFELPRTEVEAANPRSGDDAAAFFDDLRSVVEAERDAELAANRGRHRDRGLDALVRRGVAVGPFVALGRASRPDGVARYQFQVAGDDAASLVDDAGVYPDSVLRVAVRADDAPAVTVRTTRVDGGTVTVALAASCDVRPSRAESLLTDGDREFWFTHLLNPVPFDRRLDAVDSVASDDEKRALVTGQRPARFGADRFSVPSVDIALNEYQRRALKWADDADDVLCVHGPPGTGKTRTLTAYALHAAWHGQSVLVTAHSNQAVDNLLVGDSTLDDPDPGSLHGVLGDDAALAVARVGRNSRNPVVQREYADASVADADVVAATTSGAARFDSDEFDVAVVDEATQASRAATAIVLDCARKLVLAGDHRQLPPYAARDGDSDSLRPSLFEHVLETYGSDVSVLLRRQYRMHEAIADFPNEAFYGGRLETAARNRDWRVGDLDPLVGVDVAGGERRDSATDSLYNPAEVDAVADELRRLADAGVDPADVGVISPYRAQVDRIRSRVADLDVAGAERATVDTVDSFQGGEREAVVVSFVRSNDADRSGFLAFPEAGPRRLNVALTRARKRLALVGDWDTLGSVGAGRTPEDSCADVYAALAAALADAGRLRER